MGKSPLDNEALIHSPLFASMSELEFNAVTAFLERRHYKKGELIFSEGEPGREMFILLTGHVVATVNLGDGKRRKIYDFEPGAYFGEMAIIEDAPRSATCTATEDTDVLVLQGLDFYRLIFEHPMIALKLLSAISQVMTSWLDESSRFLNDLLRWGETARLRAITDSLTGLYNRRFLEESLNSRLEGNGEVKRSIAVLMMDLDRIHEINNAYGEAGGDQVIKAVAGGFRQVLRDADIAARLAGDEFAFVLPDTTLQEAQHIGERLRAAVANLTIPLSLKDKLGELLNTKVSIKTCLGVAVSPQHGNTGPALLAAADAALKKAKERGRNRVVVAE
ncbi:MAG: GGDEF domain-containing protein [Treponema sp.]|nr:GGDEF domain-containing protein [Treponema sp.]